MNDGIYTITIPMHRSVSQLFDSNYESRSEGISNEGMDRSRDDINRPEVPETPSVGCFNSEPLSPTADSEYDEFLAVPDSLSVVSVAGDIPVLVQGKHTVDASHNVTGVIPFSAIHHAPVKFKSIQRKVFIPGVPINVKIIDNERSVTTHMLNPNLYTILFTHGIFKWTVKKRYKHFQQLHQHLKLFRASLNIPFPTRSHRERRTSFKNNVVKITTNGNANTVATVKGNNKPKTGRKGALPRFPNRPEALVTAEGLQIRMEQLAEYLNNLLNISFYRNHHETVSFLEVSNLSFIADLGDSGKEGIVEKRTGSTQPGQAGCNFCGLIQNSCCIRCNYFCTDVICAKWRTRWFFVKDTCFGYIRPKDGTIRCVMLFDQGFEVSTGMYSTGLRHGLQLINNSRQMVIKCWTKRKAREWMQHLKLVASNQARDFTSPNPNSSFVPMRSSTPSHWFVDGSSYMSAVADALEAATEEIFIADWWLSPEIYMKRPVLDGDFWRLDKILERKAKQGVKVFILLYKEVELALGINSFYSKQKLVEGGENIKVLRHPDHARVGVFLWAHHEKIVVIDQTYAFLGGIDLCYGRWDDHHHRLTDLGSVSHHTLTVKGPPSRKISPAPSVRSFRTKSISSLARATNHVGASVITASSQTSIDRNSHPEIKLPVLQPGDRLLILPPQQPIVFNEPGKGPEYIKGNTPEMQRKNMLNKFKENVKRGKEGFMNMIYSPDDTTDGEAIDKLNAELEQNMFYGKNEQIIEKSPELSEQHKQEAFVSSLDGQAKYWIGKDYCNFIFKDFTNLELPFVDFIDRAVTPRMPWHDIGLMICGAAARDVSRHFIQRWNAVKLEKARENIAYPYLLPKSYQNIVVQDGALNLPLKRVTCQVLRSVSSWNCGFLELDCIEQSIHEAYVETITRAQHYIYIENQFFITLDMGNTSVKNQIGENLFKRIMRAHREKSVFRVFVVMPLLPGFEGEVGGPTGTSLHAITHWNYASISRGKSAILNRLKEAGIQHPGDYISFHGLRTHSVLNGEPVTELIYVHSKLLIADDRVVICGSANINDRSLIGKRDSEIAVLIQDEAFEEGCMNGEVFPSGLYAGSLRKYLFREHLGLLDSQSYTELNDPVIDSFWHDIWRRTSRDNTEIYESVFRCIPTDSVASFAALRKYQEEVPMSKTEPARSLQICSQSIQGNLVDLPLHFLLNECLSPPSTSKEGMMPTSLWT